MEARLSHYDDERERRQIKLLKVDGSHYQQISKQGTKERGLLVAMIERAVLDLGFENHRRFELSVGFESAHEWVFGESGEAFSFDWCCDHLGLDPGNIRKKIAGRLAADKRGLYNLRRVKQLK